MSVFIFDPKGARQHAIVAGDTTRLTRRLHDTVRGALDGVGRTNLGASWRIAMHADHRGRLRRLRAIENIQLDHRVAAMGIAFTTGLDAGIASDAARRIQEESPRLG
jgi:hypothetical protein